MSSQAQKFYLPKWTRFGVIKSTKSYLRITFELPCLNKDCRETITEFDKRLFNMRTKANELVRNHSFTYEPLHTSFSNKIGYLYGQVFGDRKSVSKVMTKLRILCGEWYVKPMDDRKRLKNASQGEFEGFHRSGYSRYPSTSSMVDNGAYHPPHSAAWDSGTYCSPHASVYSTYTPSHTTEPVLKEIVKD